VAGSHDPLHQPKHATVLRADLTHQNIPEGILIATADFTQEAIRFTKSNPTNLISGSAFLGIF